MKDSEIILPQGDGTLHLKHINDIDRQRDISSLRTTEETCACDCEANCSQVSVR